MKGQRLFDFCRRAATEFSRGFQTTESRLPSLRVTSVTPDSSVADATRIGAQPFPALKHRAKFGSPLRGCNINFSLSIITTEDFIHGFIQKNLGMVRKRFQPA